jgi:hypothetical protein
LGVLLVDAFAATMGTNVIVRNTTLRAPQGESSATLPEPHYALDLSTSDVGSDVQLTPGVVLEGGLKMRDARIGGTLWAKGLKVTDGEDDTSREAMKNRKDTPRLGLRLDTTNIKGNLLLDMDLDQLLRHARKQRHDTVNLEEFTEQFRFRSTGVVSIQNAVVNGNMSLSKAIVRKADIVMSGLTTRGQLIAVSELEEQVRKILRLPFGSDTRIPLIADKAIWLNNCHLNGDCILSANASYIDLRGTLLEGRADFDGRASYFVAPGVSTAGDFKIALVRWHVRMQSGRCKDRRSAGPSGSQILERESVKSAKLRSETVHRLGKCCAKNKRRQALEFELLRRLPFDRGPARHGRRVPAIQEHCLLSHHTPQASQARRGMYFPAASSRRKVGTSARPQ